jgi:hypothetical protein
MNFFGSNRFRSTAAVLLVVGSVLTGRAAAPLFSEDFSKVEVGGVPDSFLVLDGQFAVREEGGNRFLELPGAPLETFGVMFGPARGEDWSAQARIHATGKGRRFPVFGVSLNGVGGYRVQVAPAKNAIELLKGDDIMASAPLVWENGTWTLVRVQVRKVGDSAWKVEGKAWKEGTAEPAGWAVAWDERETPVAQRAAVWGKPFSGTPIRFDDLKIVAVEKGP